MRASVSLTSLSELRFVFSLKLDVFQDAIVNAVNQEVAPHLPVYFRPHLNFVPRAALQPGLTTGKSNEEELASARSQIPVKMGRRNI